MLLTTQAMTGCTRSGEIWFASEDCGGLKNRKENEAMKLGTTFSAGLPFQNSDPLKVFQPVFSGSTKIGCGLVCCSLGY